MCDHGVNNVLLLLGHAVENVADGLSVLLALVGMGQIIALIAIGFIADRQAVMSKSTGADDSLGFVGGNATITMFKSEVVDVSFGVGARDDEGNFADDAVDNILGLLNQRIRIDAERGNVAVLDKRFCCLAILGVIQRTVGVNAILTILKHSVPKDVIGIIVNVLVNQRDNLAISIRKCVLHDGTAIRALQADLGGIATKVILLFLALGHRYYLLYSFQFLA